MEPITASKVAFGGVKDVLNLDFPQRLIDDTIHKSPIYMGFIGALRSLFQFKDSFCWYLLSKKNVLEIFIFQVTLATLSDFRDNGELLESSANDGIFYNHNNSHRTF